MHESVLPIVHIVADAEVLVGDVERRENGDLERVAGRALLEREPHFLVDVGGEVGDVSGVQPALDRVTLSVDLDGHDPVRLFHARPSVLGSAFEVPGSRAMVLRTLNPEPVNLGPPPRG
ncbi:MAG TPA: hypothetical protein VFJ02_18650 [Vicinamibacterales bacterium]|nr:hypothetical protein [Vicinamibacterales bacterium]